MRGYATSGRFSVLYAALSCCRRRREFRAEAPPPGRRVGAKLKCVRGEHVVAQGRRRGRRGDGPRGHFVAAGTPSSSCGPTSRPTARWPRDGGGGGRRPLRRRRGSSRRVPDVRRARRWTAEIAPGEFPAVERALVAWAPDVLLVMDPDMFLLDTFRVPGFNGLMAQAGAGVDRVLHHLHGRDRRQDARVLVGRQPAGARALRAGPRHRLRPLDHIFLNGDDSSQADPGARLGVAPRRRLRRRRLVARRRRRLCTRRPPTRARRCPPPPPPRRRRRRGGGAAAPSPSSSLCTWGASRTTNRSTCSSPPSPRAHRRRDGRACGALPGRYRRVAPSRGEYEETHPGGVHYAGHAPHHQVACVLREVVHTSPLRPTRREPPPAPLPLSHLPTPPLPLPLLPQVRPPPSRRSAAASPCRMRSATSTSPTTPTASSRRTRASSPPRLRASRTTRPSAPPRRGTSPRPRRTTRRQDARRHRRRA